MRITDAFLQGKSLQPGTYSDDMVPNGAIDVGTRRKTWWLRYVDAAGRRSRKTFGHYRPGQPGHVGIADWRKAANDFLDRVEKGIPPQPAPDAAAKNADAVTIGRLAEFYETARFADGDRIKTFGDSIRCIRMGLADYLDLPASQFTRADLRAARDAYNERGRTAANRFLAYASGMFSWAVENDLIDRNFASDLKRNAEKQRDRVLSLDELAGLWLACDRLGGGRTRQSYVGVIRMCILTGQRLNEVARMRHGDLIDRRIWAQSKDNKPGRAHRLPLPPLAVSLIGEGSSPRDYVFPSSTGHHLGDWGKRKDELDKASGIADWVQHDLRRSFASHLLEMDVNPLVVELLLNHALPGVMKNYFKTPLEEQRRDALRRWAEAVEAAVAKAGKTLRA
jgi:integrase